MEKLLFKKPLSDIQTADGFSDSCGFWFLCWHHYSRWEKGLQALQEFISENEKPNMTDHPVFLTADVWIPGKADIIEQIAWRKKTNEKMVHDSDNYAGHSFMCLSAENGPGNNACSGNRAAHGGFICSGAGVRVGNRAVYRNRSSYRSGNRATGGDGSGTPVCHRAGVSHQRTGAGNRTGRGTGHAGPPWRSGNLQRVSAAGRRARSDHGIHEN